MKTRIDRQDQRAGFTLIELLVVIAIIAILMGLISAAVAQALKTAKRAGNRHTISQVQEGLALFKQKFGRYPPSRIKLCEVYSNYGNTQLDTDSVAFITQMFPKILNYWQANGIDWNGNGVIDNAPNFPKYVILEGDQCLVFFLGGIPIPAGNGSPPGVQGFSNNPQNPADFSNPSATKIGPFYEFDANRLVILAPTANSLNGRSQTHYSYLDDYGVSNGTGSVLSGQPYAYFSSYNQRNGYNRYVALGLTTDSDCATLQYVPPSTAIPTQYVWPYAEAVSGTAAAWRYLNPETFQVVSAGADGLFGPGTNPYPPTGLTAQTWTQSTAPLSFPQGTPGYDDQSNFVAGLLGVGQ